MLKAARAGARGRVIAVVQPHRYTRVHDLFDEFCACFRDADSVIVAPVYSAGEPPIDGIDHALRWPQGIRRAGHPAVTAIDSERDLVPIVRRMARRAIWSSASAPAPSPSGRMRFPIGCAPISRRTESPARRARRAEGAA